MPGDTRVYFCAVAPSVHCGNVVKDDWRSVLRARIEGRIHNGACRLCTKIGESVMAPRSAGCSRIYSAPASRAARRSRTVRLTSSLDSRSSRAWLSGISGNPMALSRSRTGGGPPSSAVGAAKKRETVNVEQGGDASTADAPPGVRVVVYGVGGVAKTGQERRDPVPSMYETGEEKESSSGATAAVALGSRCLGPAKPLSVGGTRGCSTVGNPGG
eukprot:6212828-Pleurochrysis_carterae.AAC.2